MRRHLLCAAMLTASLAFAAAAGSFTTINAAASAAATTTAAAGPTGLPSRSVFLVTGERVSAEAIGRAGASVMIGGPGQDADTAGPLQTLTEGGTTEVLPVTAAPYVGRVLAPELFEPRALAKAESAGRLPVRIAFPSVLPALPGVTITSSGRGTAKGYLTAAGARMFGSALVRQYAADHARASYGQDGILNGVDITLAGTAPTPPVPRPAFKMHTVIVSATDLSGRPDTGDVISLFNIDAPIRFGAGLVDDRSFFYHGTARFSVPAGHYYAVANFCCNRSAEHVVIVPQSTVSPTAGTTTLQVSERSANSRISFATPRSAVLQDESFVMLRLAANGSGFLQSWEPAAGSSLRTRYGSARPRPNRRPARCKARLRPHSPRRPEPQAPPIATNSTTQARAA